MGGAGKRGILVTEDVAIVMPNVIGGLRGAVRRWRAVGEGKRVTAGVGGQKEG